jgi:phospholipase D3/4
MSLSGPPQKTTPYYDAQPSRFRSLEDDSSFDNTPTSSQSQKKINFSTREEEEVDGYGGRETNTLLSNQSKDENISKWNLVLYWHLLVVFLLSLIIVVCVLSVSLVKSRKRMNALITGRICEKSCSYQLVESIPDQVQLQLLPGTNYTFNAWMDMIQKSKRTLKIAAFYSNLRNNYSEPHSIGGWMGTDVINAIVNAHKRGVQITIVQNSPNIGFPNVDTEWLRANKIANVVYVDWAAALKGVLHTKLIIADDEQFYVGSANFDWTSLAQVKELGIYVTNCACLANDIQKIWGVYKYLGADLKSHLNQKDFFGFPENLQTNINMLHPLNMSLENPATGTGYGNVFISSSPQAINPPERTNDIIALLHVIKTAKKSVAIEVMDYLPLDNYGSPRTYWGEIEDALKDAIIRNVTIRMLVSKWNQTSHLQVPVIESLNKFGNFCHYSWTNNETNPWCTGSITVKQFHIPNAEGYEPIPFTRVNHAKFMVSDNLVYISTSNWSYDYFYRTAGISFVSSHEQIRQTAQTIFERDWSSIYVI